MKIGKLPPPDNYDSLARREGEHSRLPRRNGAEGSRQAALLQMNPATSPRRKNKPQAPMEENTQARRHGGAKGKKSPRALSLRALVPVCLGAFPDKSPGMLVALRPTARRAQLLITI